MQRTVPVPTWGTFKTLQEAVYGFSKAKIQRLRADGTWIEGVHWTTTLSTGRLLFNLPLINDWLVNGNGDAHQRAIEIFLASLPSNKKSA